MPFPKKIHSAYRLRCEAFEVSKKGFDFKKVEVADGNSPTMRTIEKSKRDKYVLVLSGEELGNNMRILITDSSGQQMEVLLQPLLAGG